MFFTPCVLLNYSVKQKLVDIYKVTGGGDNLCSSTDVTQQNKEDSSQSIDDTLRSTSPMPDNEEIPTVSPPASAAPDNTSTGCGSHISPAVTENISGEVKPGLLIRSNSYTVDEPSKALLNSKQVSCRITQSHLTLR